MARWSSRCRSDRLGSVRWRWQARWSCGRRLRDRHRGGSWRICSLVPSDRELKIELEASWKYENEKKADRKSKRGGNNELYSNLFSRHGKNSPFTLNSDSGKTRLTVAPVACCRDGRVPRSRVFVAQFRRRRRGDATRRCEVVSGRSSGAKPAEAAADLNHGPPAFIETANNFLISRHEEHSPVTWAA